MNNTIKNTKQIYKKPSIILIELDNEISLILESSPPIGPNEAFLTPENCKFEPYKI